MLSPPEDMVTTHDLNLLSGFAETLTRTDPFPLYVVGETEAHEPDTEAFHVPSHVTVIDFDPEFLVKPIDSGFTLKVDD